MATITLDRPTPQAPAQRFAGIDLAVRATLLLVISLSWLSLLPIHLAASRPAEQLVIDLKADKVASIQYAPKTRTLKWSDGGIRWYAADLTLGRPDAGPSAETFSSGGNEVEGDSSANVADRNWVNSAIDAAGLRRRLDLDDSSDRSWASPVPWHGLPLAAGLAVILSFFLMLGRDRRSVGNRWAWFWVFTMASAVGPALFLLLEPTPPWRRLVSLLPSKRSLSGGQGFLVALVLKGCLAYLGRHFFAS